MAQTTYQVDAFWDAEATVWVATSEDVPGLATEADTIEALSQRLRQIIPDLLLLNHVISADYAGTIALAELVNVPILIVPVSG
jgi:putative cell wall-binding protein